MLRKRTALVATVIAIVAGIASPPATAQDLAAPCGGAAIARGTVSHVIDGRTFTLDDGREVRLAALEVPSQPSGGAAAKTALEALAGGDDVMLRRADSASDRYGRLVAYAYTLRDGDTLFVQAELVAGGFARVGAEAGSRGCAGELLGREKTARNARLGLWGDPDYRVFDADASAEVLARRGRFVLVEGEVQSVRQSGSTIYLNFGRHWVEDFAATVQQRDGRIFAASGLDLMRLRGSRVRVRGFVEARGAEGTSPRIAIERPEQIEIVGGE